MKKIFLPRRIYVGYRISQEARNFLEKNSKPLVLSGQVTYKIYGQEIEKITNAKTMIVESNYLEDAKRIADEIKGKYDLIFGVGGGKVLDIAKTVAFYSELDWVSVPTNCAHDGLASPFASLKDSEKLISLSTKMPIGILADLAIFPKANKIFIASGVGDIIAKKTAVYDWKLANIVTGEYMGDYASSLAEMTATIVLDNIKEIKNLTNQGISVLIEALISSGMAMAIAGSSRPASGSEHKFAHALDSIAKYPSLHGIETGIGAILMGYLQGQNWKKIKEALEEVGAPTTLKEINVSFEQGLEALLMARKIKPERYTILEHIKLDEDLAKKALIETKVGKDDI
ncbi:MAG: sn-glycerol-1-phosphate dehydrogenase [archaeon]